MEDKKLNQILVLMIMGLLIALSGVWIFKAQIVVQQPAPVFEEWVVEQEPSPIVEKEPKPDPMPEGGVLSYGEALQRSQKTGKKIFVYFYADWCPWCSKMKRDTLDNATVKEALKDYIVCFVDREDEKQIALRYAIAGLPGYVIVDGKEALQKKGVGYKTPDEFIRWLIGNRFWENGPSDRRN
jgi:thiol:disulfide interchange protein DsbD